MASNRYRYFLYVLDAKAPQSVVELLVFNKGSDFDPNFTTPAAPLNLADVMIMTSNMVSEKKAIFAYKCNAVTSRFTRAFIGAKNLKTVVFAVLHSVDSATPAWFLDEAVAFDDVAIYEIIPASPQPKMTGDPTDPLVDIIKVVAKSASAKAFHKLTGAPLTTLWQQMAENAND